MAVKGDAEPKGVKMRDVRVSGSQRSACIRRAGALVAVGVLWSALLAANALAPSTTPVASAAVSSARGEGVERAAAPSKGASSLEAAASKAGDTGRAVAMSLIGLAFAVAATVLAFRRDFREAAGVFAVGIVSVLLATPAGISLLRDTVSSLFGTQ
jgi:hypothetical protein